MTHTNVSEDNNPNATTVHQQVVKLSEESLEMNHIKIDRSLDQVMYPLGMRQSQLVTRTRREDPSGEPSINAQLLTRAGFVSQLMAGVYSYLPLGMRVLSKIEDIVRQEMVALGGQEILMAALQPREIWDQTQRWDKVDVLFRFKGAGDRDMTLGPTHEEVVTPLVGQFLESYRDLPTSVFQIQTKFRNEARAKSGVLRGREFRMKDMYSFHQNQEDLDAYYDRVLQGYHRIFERVGIGDTTYLTFASGGVFSKFSHEFQTVTQYGEDTIYLCQDCRVAVNKELIEEHPHCPECNKTGLVEQKAIEVGNIFKLSTRFADAFNVKVHDRDGSSGQVIMGCYGLGTTRLVGTIVEALHDKDGMRWPRSVAPFTVHLISLAREASTNSFAEEVFSTLIKNGIEVLFDDREASAGQKFKDSDLIGLPYRAVIGERHGSNAQIELRKRDGSEAEIVSLDQLLEFLKLN